MTYSVPSLSFIEYAFFMSNEAGHSLKTSQGHSRLRVIKDKQLRVFQISEDKIHQVQQAYNV